MFIRTIAFTIGLVAAALGAVAAGTATAQSRDDIRIVGSSTVFPFATTVAETFGRTTEFPTPVIESTGSGGGLKLFCSGVGPQHPDITNASRRIKVSEFDRCNENGVSGIVEVKIGYDGIVLANSRAASEANYTRAQIWQALAKTVVVNGELVENPYTKWSDIDPSLPQKAIEVLGPPPTSGTRDAFVELVMEEGCEAFDVVNALPKSERGQVCGQIREDGAYIEAGENDNLIVQKLVANSDAYGVFGFSFLDQNSDKIQGAQIEGVSPEFDAIADGSYPVSRPLFFYVKKTHVGVIPGMRSYLAEFTSERAWGPEGYLSDKGLIPLPNELRAAERSKVLNLVVLQREDLL